MSWIIETPWPAIWMGAVIEGLLGVALFHTRRRSIVAAMASVAAAVALLVIIERLVMTDTERVAHTLEQAAAALETNEVSNVLVLMAPDAAELRAHAQNQLPRLDIRDANIGGDLKVTINRLTNPPTARATFTARLTGKSQTPREALPYDHYVRRVTLKLRKADARWLLTEFEEARALSDP